MKYMLLIYLPEARMYDLPKEEAGQVHAAYMAYTEAMKTAGAFIANRPYWAARAALLAQDDRADEAAHAYRVAIGLEADPAVRRFLQRQLAAIVPEDPGR